MDILEKASKAPPIKIEGLSYQQLIELKNQLDNDINMIQASLEQLLQASIRYEESKHKLSVFNPEHLNREVLVPLTSSVFIPGKLENTKSVLIEIGGSFVIEKTIDQAGKFCQRKADEIKKTCTLMGNIVNKKRKDLDATILAIQDIVSKMGPSAS